MAFFVRVGGARLRIIFASLVVIIACSSCDETKQLKRLPIRVEQGRTFLTNSRFVKFTNTGDTSIPVRVVFENPTFHQSKAYNLVLSPGQTMEIGSWNGWSLVSGDRVHLYSNGYDYVWYNVE
jgi:hypothetical protein